MSEEQKKPDQQKDEKGFIEELLGDVINLDRGLPATFLDMFRRPGHVIESYFVDKGRYVNPFRYTIFIATIVTLLTTFFIDFSELFDSIATDMGGVEGNPILETEGGREYFENVKEVGILLSTQFIAINYIFLLAPSIAFTSFLFFKKIKPKYRNHLVMSLYYAAQLATFSVITIPLMLNLDFFDYFIWITVGMQLAFVLWVYKSYLDIKGLRSYIKATIAYLLGYFLYMIILSIVMYGAAAIMYFSAN